MPSFLDGKSTLLEYHRQEGDPSASVSAWQDNQRLITFSVPLTGVPELVKTAIGGANTALHCPHPSRKEAEAHRRCGQGPAR